MRASSRPALTNRARNAPSKHMVYLRVNQEWAQNFAVIALPRVSGTAYFVSNALPFDATTINFIASAWQ
eukprot:4782053-Amphidinium_carterae.1